MDGVPNAQAASGVQLLTGLYLFKYVQSLVRVFQRFFGVSRTSVLMYIGLF